MPTFKLTAKTDFGSGTKKVGRGSFIMMTGGSSTFALSTSQITEAVRNQLGIDCIPAHKTYFNIERVG